MKKSAILLDAGGILLDETEMEQSFCDFTVEILNRFGISYSENQYWEDIQESVRCFAPKTRLFVFWKYCSGDILKYEEIANAFQELRKQNGTSLKLMEGISDELLKLTPRFSFALAGQYGADVYKLLDAHQIGNLFIKKYLVSSAP